MTGIRRAGVQDAGQIAEIEVETWRSTYAGVLTDRTLTGMSVDRQTRLWQSAVRQYPGDIWVAEESKAGLLGFGHCGAQRHHSLPFEGEVYTLYVQPDSQGSGLGRRLLFALFRRLVAAGRRSALIWVVRANPSRFFYERMGGKLVFERKTPISGGMVDTLGYGWSDLPALLQNQARRGEPSTGGQSAP
jgi:ribosomal protein S18 acetylase RimI-like enzyme